MNLSNWKPKLTAIWEANTENLHGIERRNVPEGMLALKNKAGGIVTA